MIRGLSDVDLARVVREGLDDRSLVTLFAAALPIVVNVEHGPLHPSHISDLSDSDKCAPSGVTARVENLIRSQAGIGTREIRRRLDGDTPTGIRKALRRLVTTGRIRREGCTSDSRYFPVLRAVEGSA